MHVTFKGYKKNKLNAKNIYSNVIFIDERELFYMNYRNFQQKFS